MIYTCDTCINNIHTMKFIQTLTEMFTQRGYFEIKETHEFTNFLQVLTNDKEKVYVFANFIEKISVNLFKECLAFLEQNNSTHCIIITSEGITPCVKKIIDNSYNIRIEVFSEDELGYNVTKHCLVPKHELATSEELAELKKHLPNLPIILHKDPVIRFLGYEKKQVVKITRKSGAIVFRIII